MCSVFLLPAIILTSLLRTSAASNPTVEWKQDWSAELPHGAKGTHRGWIGFGSGHDGGKYVENGWHDSWQSGTNTDGWDKKHSWGDGWTGAGQHKWSWGSGGAHGSGYWGSANGKSGGYSSGSGIDNSWKWGSTDGQDGYGAAWSGTGGYEPEHSYSTWGNVNSDSWKNSGGGEGWSKWEDGDGLGREGREHGGWKSWKSGMGGGNWDSWKSSNKPTSAKAEAYASASADP